MNMRVSVTFDDGQFQVRSWPSLAMLSQPRALIHELIREAEKLWEVPPGTVKSRDRKRSACEPRFAVAYAARRMTTRSYPDIARIMGDFDHSTIIHAERRAKQMKVEDADYAALLAQLMRNVREKQVVG